MIFELFRWLPPSMRREKLNPHNSGEAWNFQVGGRDLNFFFHKAIFQVYQNFRGVETDYIEIFLHENYIPYTSQKKFRGVGRPPGPLEAAPLL